MRVNQFDLIRTIGSHLSQQHPGWTMNQRQLNAIVRAADMIVDAFAKSHAPARDEQGRLREERDNAITILTAIVVENGGEVTVGDLAVATANRKQLEVEREELNRRRIYRAVDR